MNTLYLNTLLRGVDTLTEEQLQDIETLAMTCPYVGGNAVYRARVLHGIKHWNIHYDELELCNGQGVYKGGNSKLQDQLAMLQHYMASKTVSKNIITDDVKLYPNPTFNELTLVCKGAEQVMVYDVLGRVQLSVPVNKDLVENKINTATLAQGVYIVKIQRADQAIFTTKIIKE
jgi:hypothetical protein